MRNSIYCNIIPTSYMALHGYINKTFNLPYGNVIKMSAFNNNTDILRGYNIPVHIFVSTPSASVSFKIDLSTIELNATCTYGRTSRRT